MITHSGHSTSSDKQKCFAFESANSFPGSFVSPPSLSLAWGDARNGERGCWIWVMFFLNWSDQEKDSLNCRRHQHHSSLQVSCVPYIYIYLLSNWMSSFRLYQLCCAVTHCPSEKIYQCKNENHVASFLTTSSSRLWLTVSSVQFTRARARLEVHALRRESSESRASREFSVNFLLFFSWSETNLSLLVANFQPSNLHYIAKFKNTNTLNELLKWFLRP